VGVGSPESLSEALSTTPIPKVRAYYLGVHDIENNERMGEILNVLRNMVYGKNEAQHLGRMCLLKSRSIACPFPFCRRRLRAYLLLAGSKGELQFPSKNFFSLNMKLASSQATAYSMTSHPPQEAHCVRRVVIEALLVKLIKNLVRKKIKLSLKLLISSENLNTSLSIRLVIY
jgi:hypothetical protein